MSFIYENSNLISELLKAATESETKLSKQGQVDPAAQQNADALRMLLNNLRSQITPLKEGPEQVGHAAGVADLASRNMDSMGDFVEWLSKHGTRVGGAIVVYPGNVDRPSEDYGFYKIEPGTEIVVPLARPDRSVVAYWINPGALKKYLVSLQADPKLKSNTMFQVQLLKLIQDANRQLDLDVSEKYQAPEVTLPDNTQVDMLPSTLIVGQWGTGAVPLLIGNIRSLETLNAWFAKNNIAVQAGEKQQPATIRDRNFNQCAGIQILFERASAFASRATPETKAGAQAYLKQITEIARQANCSVSSATTTETGEGTGGAPGTVSNRALAGLAALRPFNSQRIDFREITTFLDKYKVIANKAEINSLVDQVKNSIADANSKLQSPGAALQMDNLTTTQARLWVKDPAHQAIPLMNNLYTIISVAGRVYLDFLTECKNHLGEQVADSVEQQITSGGPQQTNIGTILRVRESLMNEIPRGR